MGGDAVYADHFKCSLRRIVDYPSLWSYVRNLYQRPGIAETVRFDEIRRHYYLSHGTINPNGIVALSPDADFTAPHEREHMGAASRHSANAGSRSQTLPPPE